MAHMFLLKAYEIIYVGWCTFKFIDFLSFAYLDGGRSKIFVLNEKERRKNFKLIN